MKQISEELKAHLAQEVTTLATCWKVTRRDGEVRGFTDHDEDIVYDSITYEAASGFTPTAVQSSAALNVDNLDVEGMLDANSISESDILAGRYDFAEIDVFMLNYADVSQGKLPLRQGWLGEVTMQNGQFVAEVRGLTQSLQHSVGQLYSPGCRASLGDARCGVEMAGQTFSGAVTSVTSRSHFADSSRGEGDGFFSYGSIRFTSGDNAGLSMEVKEFADGAFVLVMPMAYAVEVGDAYEVKAGCDKSLHTCATRYNNAVNFRGEPHVPGTDRMLETAATRSSWE